MARNSKPPELETLDRVRRIETRLTQTMVALGVPTQAAKAQFEDGRVTLPSRHSSLMEAVDCIPRSWIGPVDVFVDGSRVAKLDYYHQNAISSPTGATPAGGMKVG